MAKLNDDQIAFLRSHNIEIDEMFDASGMRPEQRKAAMEAVGKRFYFGGAPCARAGHTLRVKAGHCIQCAPQHIAFGTRYSTSSALYVAASMQGRVVKVGLAKSPQDRLKHLLSESYGGFADWVILATTNVVEEAGRLEAAVQQQLGHFSRDGVYRKGGAELNARELFACNFSTAANALMDLLPKSAQLKLCCTVDQAKRYDWYDPAPKL